MKHIPLPKKFIVEEVEAGTKARIIIEPCFPGYGMTLGNALRRVLLSSLPGGAATAVKINGVQHEFSTLENVSEDIVAMILNLKKLRFKVYSDESVVLKLSAKGQKKVTGADIEASSDAEVVNLDEEIATLNDKNAKLDMEITVAKGIGYVPTEEQSKEKGEIGLILVDSIFTPVVNVGLDIEVTRVGQKTDYDKLVLNVETDGTISPADAVKKAAEILTNQFSWIIEGGDKDIEEVDIEAPVKVIEKEVEVSDEPEVVEAESAAEAMADKEVPVAEKTKKRGRPKKIEE